METASYMRYILIGNRKILVEQPDGDKYRSVTEDIAVKQSVEGIRTEECVLAITNDGLFIGSSAGVGTHITPSEFAEAKSGISTSHSVVGHAYITRMPSVKSGMSTHHSVKGISSATKLGEAGSGIVSTHEANGKATHSRLTKASEGIGTESRGEAFYTAEPKFADGNSGMSVGDQAEGKATEAKLSQVQSGASTTQTAEAYVENPPERYYITAGTYVGTGTVFSAPLPTMGNIDVDVSFEQYGDPYTCHGLSIFSILSLCYLVTFDNEESNVYIGQQTATLQDPNKFYMEITTDDNSFTIENDVEVTVEQYAVFYQYFKSTTAVIPAGTYEPVPTPIDPTTVPLNRTLIEVPLAYSLNSEPLTASYLDLYHEAGVVIYVSGDRIPEEDADFLGWATIGDDWVFGYWGDNGTITVTADATVPIEHYNLFFTLFQSTN